MKNPFDFFDKIFYINLDSRPDRREQMEEQLTKFGIKAQRFPAIYLSDEQNQELKERGCHFYDDTRPEYAPRIKSCSLTHLMVLSLAKQLALRNVLILEDDCVFDENILEELALSLKELGDRPWDMFYIGANPLQFYKLSDHLARGVSLLTTHAYAVNGHFVDYILNNNYFMQRPCIDGWYCTLNRQRIFMSLKNLAKQSKGHSDIENQEVDYSLVNRYVDIKGSEIEYNPDIITENEILKQK